MLKDNFGVTELDIELYYELKQKILKLMENRKRYNKEIKSPSKVPDSTSQVVQEKVKETTSLKKTFHEVFSINRLDKKRSLPSITHHKEQNQAEKVSIAWQQANKTNEKLPAISSKFKNDRSHFNKTFYENHDLNEPHSKVPNLTYTSQFTELSKGRQTRIKESLINDQIFYKAPGSVRGSEVTIPHSNQSQDLDSNKYFKRKPFSWVSLGDSFNMVNPERVYLTKPDLSSNPGSTPRTKINTTEVGCKSTISTMYSQKWEKTGLREIAEHDLLQVKEPYLLQSSADFYRKVIPPRLPPPPPKQQTTPVRGLTVLASEKPKISKFILIPEGEKLGKSKTATREWIAADFTKHQMSMYQPLHTSSPDATSRSLERTQNPKGETLSEEEQEGQFKGIIVQKFVFENSKKELEAIKKLIVNYEPRDNAILAQTATLPQARQSALGYSRQQFDNENQKINLFLQTLAQSSSPQISELASLKQIVDKRLAIVNDILKNLDVDGHVKQYVKQKEAKYLKFLEKRDEAGGLKLVGTNFGYSRDALRTQNKQRKQLFKRNSIGKNTDDKSQDSGMEAESSSEGSLDRNIHYQKVLNRKVNIDQLQLTTLCVGFIKKEVKRIKHALQVNDYKRKMLPNPNRSCTSSIGFSDNLMALLKRNKEFIPPDIKMDLLKILPQTYLRELGSDMFIDDETVTMAISRELEDERLRAEAAKRAKADKNLKFGPASKEEFKDAMDNFAKMAEELGKELKNILGENEEGANQNGDEGTSDSNLQKLTAMETNSLTDSQKAKLMSRGLVVRNGRLMMKDTVGNLVDLKAVIHHKNDIVNQQILRDLGAKNTDLDSSNKLRKLGSDDQLIGICN